MHNFVVKKIPYNWIFDCYMKLFKWHLYKVAYVLSPKLAIGEATIDFISIS